MKNLLTASILAFALTTGAHAADHMGHMDHGAMSAKTPNDASLTEGVVKKVDKAAGKITITHGPLPNGMPGMTMTLKVKEAAKLSGLKEGQKVFFAVDDAMTVVRLETAK